MKKHRRYTEIERQQHLSQIKLSKSSLESYSLSSGVSLSCLRYWSYSRYKSKGVKKAEGFLAVNIIEEESGPIEVILEYIEGTRMTIRGSVSASYLKSLV